MHTTKHTHFLTVNRKHSCLCLLIMMLTFEEIVQKSLIIHVVVGLGLSLITCVCVVVMCRFNMGKVQTQSGKGTWRKVKTCVTLAHAESIGPDAIDTESDASRSKGPEALLMGEGVKNRLPSTSGATTALGNIAGVGTGMRLHIAGVVYAAIAACKPAAVESSRTNNKNDGEIKRETLQTSRT
jgi:hypothetical protein